MGDLISCETDAAYVIHARRVSKTGPHYGGGADTPTLCGLKASWDTRIPLAAISCRECRQRIEGDSAKDVP